MRLPRDVSGGALVTALRRLGYEKVRQRGSHVRITTQAGGEHHEVIPLHDPIRTKTLSSILIRARSLMCCPITSRPSETTRQSATSLACSHRISTSIQLS